MLKVGKVMDTLAKDYPELAKKVQPVFVSVDPARDSLKGTFHFLLQCMLPYIHSLTNLHNSFFI